MTSCLLSDKILIRWLVPRVPFFTIQHILVTEPPRSSVSTLVFSTLLIPARFVIMSVYLSSLISFQFVFLQECLLSLIPLPTCSFYTSLAIKHLGHWFERHKVMKVSTSKSSSWQKFNMTAEKIGWLDTSAVQKTWGKEQGTSCIEPEPVL